DLHDQHGKARRHRAEELHERQRPEQRARLCREMNVDRSRQPQGEHRAKPDPHCGKPLGRPGREDPTLDAADHVGTLTTRPLPHASTVTALHPMSSGCRETLNSRQPVSGQSSIPPKPHTMKAARKTATTARVHAGTRDGARGCSALMPGWYRRSSSRTGLVTL